MHRIKLLGILLISVVLLEAEDQNLIRTRILEVGKTDTGTDADLVTTVYNDADGKTMQVKTSIDASKDLVNCTFFDEIGREKYITKSFVDNEHPGYFLPGDFNNINDSNGQLRLQYAAFDGPDPDNDPNAYSEVVYYEDPLSRIRESGSPGEEHRIGAHSVRFWYFGISRIDVSSIGVYNGTILTGTVSFKNGFIKTMVPVTGKTESDLLDDLYTHLLKANPNPFDTITHSLSVVKDQNGNFTQEIYDIFGRIIATRSDPTSNSDDEIIAEYEYNALGQLIAEKAPKHAPESGSPNQLIENSTYEYNPLGQLVRKKLPDGAVQTYEYNDAGLLIFEKYFRGSTLIRELKYSYDKFKRNIKIENCTTPASVGVKQYETKILMFYDNIDSLSYSAKKYGMPTGFLQSLKNLKGRLVASVGVNRIKGREYYVTDIFDYDDEGRTSVKYKIIPGLPMQKLSFEYDLQGKVTEETFECGTESVTKKYNYNSLGMLQSIEHVGGTSDTLIMYDYNDLLQLKSKNLKSGTGHQVNFSYNIQELLTSIQSPASAGFYETISYNGSYNGNIMRTDYSYKNAILKTYDQQYTYDNVNRLVGVSSSDTLFNATYSYDEVGRFKSKEEGDSNNDDYQYYTNVNRMKKAKTGGSEYIYNEHGSLVIDIGKKMVIEYDWREMPVLFRFYDRIPVSSTEIGADPHGTYTINDVSCPGCSLYEYLEHLEKNSAINLLSTVTMVYDAAGNRVCKISGNN